MINAGLSTFGSNTAGIANYLKPLTDYALAQIPTKAQSTTPLYLKATAGMRALPETQRNNVMTTVRSIFRELPFMFNDDWASIISGSEEGAFNWIAANYLLGKLTSTEQAANQYVGMLVNALVCHP